MSSEVGKRRLFLYEKGASRPAGYLATIEWAADQAAYGLKQRKCAECYQWVFPQEPCMCGVEGGTRIPKKENS